MKKTILSIPSQLTGSFVYVDCGSRGEHTKSLLSHFEDATYVGFDPGLDNSEKMNKDGTSHVYYPVALGNKPETKTFYHTQNPNCSSVFPPNEAFVDQFVDLGPFFKTVQTSAIEVVTLDDFLPAQGIDQVDFIELDVQGAELEILQGAKDFLSSTVFGLKSRSNFRAFI